MLLRWNHRLRRGKANGFQEEAKEISRVSNRPLPCDLCSAPSLLRVQKEVLPTTRTCAKRSFRLSEYFVAKLLPSDSCYRMGAPAQKLHNVTVYSTGDCWRAPGLVAARLSMKKLLKISRSSGYLKTISKLVLPILVLPILVLAAARAPRTLNSARSRGNLKVGLPRLPTSSTIYTLSAVSGSPPDEAYDANTGCMKRAYKCIEITVPRKSTSPTASQISPSFANTFGGMTSGGIRVIAIEIWLRIFLLMHILPTSPETRHHSRFHLRVRRWRRGKRKVTDAGGHRSARRSSIYAPKSRWCKLSPTDSRDWTTTHVTITDYLDSVPPSDCRLLKGVWLYQGEKG